MTSSDPVLRLDSVRLVRDRTVILDGIDWDVGPDQRWVLLGPNGSGKTSLIRIAALYLHPSSGSVTVLGGELGRIDVRDHRRGIGFVSAALADLLRPTLTAAEVVVTAKHAALEPWWHTYEPADHERALALLGRFGCAPLADRRFGTLSSGERQRVLLARSLMTEPGLVLLDEPMAGLDLGGREDVVNRLGDLAADSTAPATVLVTHHVDEIPRHFTHALLLKSGRILGCGPLTEVVTASNLSRCFDCSLSLEQRDGRYRAWS